MRRGGGGSRDRFFINDISLDILVRFVFRFLLAEGLGSRGELPLASENRAFALSLGNHGGISAVLSANR